MAKVLKDRFPKAVAVHVLMASSLLRLSFNTIFKHLLGARKEIPSNCLNFDHSLAFMVARRVYFKIDGNDLREILAKRFGCYARGKLNEKDRGCWRFRSVFPSRHSCPRSAPLRQIWLN